MDHAKEAEALLLEYERERASDDFDDVQQRQHYLVRMLATAQVHATLAVADELERHRIAGWGRMP